MEEGGQIIMFEGQCSFGGRYFGSNNKCRDKWDRKTDVNVVINKERQDHKPTWVYKRSE